MSELARLHALARGQDSKLAHEAIEELAARGADDAQTVELLIELLESEACHDSDLVKIGDAWAKHHVRTAAVAAIRQIGGAAVEAVLARIATPSTPSDERLLVRARAIGRPLFDLARILVTDGDARRAREAEAIVAEFANELDGDEAVAIYLAVAERERLSLRPTWVLQAIWSKLRTAEARAAIAERWEARGLREWIELRLDRDPQGACVLNALLIAGPEEAVPILQASLATFTTRARWTAIESMLMIDPLRTGAVLWGDASLKAWARQHLRRRLFGELELRFRIACGRDSSMFEVFNQYDFRSSPHLVIEVMRTMSAEDAAAWRDRLRDTIDQYPGNIHAARTVQLVLEAFPP